MIAGTVWNQLKLTLENNPTIARYCKGVFEIKRFDLEPESFPCIMLDPVRDGEIIREMNEVQDVYLTVDIYAFSSNNLNEFNKSVVGDAMYKGIFDINNDIRACLGSSYTLGNRVIDIKFDTTEFSQEEKYPVRGMRMPIRIMYRQRNGV